MTTTQNASSLILKNLKLFNDAMKYLDGEMSLQFTDAVKIQVQSFATSNKWFGDLTPSDLDDCTLAPPQWNKTPAKAKKPQALASFDIYSIEPSEDQYYYPWIPLFCDVTDGEVGLIFDVNDRYIDTEKWQQHVASLSPESSKKLNELGFEYRDDEECFFLPVTLDPLALADAWDSGDLKSALKPLTDALNKLPKAAEVFDPMLQLCII
jgi:hypothetical protein